MSKFTPWTQKQAEQWATEWWINFPGDARVDPMDGETFRGWTATHRAAFLAGLSKAAEMIEACPTVYKSTNSFGVDIWTKHTFRGNTTGSAKLVGVRKIEGEQT